MSRADAERVFGRELVAVALADPTPTRAADAVVRAFADVAALASERARDDLPTFRMLVTTWLSTLTPDVGRALVRVVIGGVASELADVERSEARERMH